MGFGTKADEGVVGLAKVTDGWTGSIALVASGVTTTITPSARDSAARILIQLVTETTRDTGADAQAWVDASGKVRIYCSVSYRLVSSGTTQSRLDTPAATIYAAGVTFEASSAHANGYYPAYGLKVNGAPAAFTSSDPTGAGAYAQAVIFDSRSYSFVGYDTLANQWDQEVALSNHDTWDVWRDGFYVARVRLGKTSRDRWGALGTQARLSMQASMVRSPFL